MTKPQIRFIRPLMQSPKLYEAVKNAVGDRADPSRGNVIGADEKEYVYLPVGDDGYVLVEAVPTSNALGYIFDEVPDAEGLFRASIEAWERAPQSPRD
jgi:hypothetical protein